MPSVTERRRVLIADDHRNMLARLTGILDDDYEVVAAVADGEAAVDAAAKFQPDVAILDVSMPRLNGFEAAERIAAAAGGAGPRVVFLTVYEDDAFIEAARRAGGNGYVLKRTLGSALLPALAQVLAGGSAFPH